MNFPIYKAQRISEMLLERWGDKRIPDLFELFNIAKPKSVLEIGCFRGVSTEFWLLHCARVVAVDPWPEITVRRDFLNRCGHYPHLRMIEGFSPQAIETASDPVGDFDLCYIDGDHSYDAVKKDIAVCLPLVKPGMFIGGHDYGGDCPGVAQAVDEAFGAPPWRFSDGSWLVKL